MIADHSGSGQGHSSLPDRAFALRDGLKRAQTPRPSPPSRCIQSWALATTRRRARPVQRRSSPPPGGRIRDHRCHFRRTGHGATWRRDDAATARVHSPGRPEPLSLDKSKGSPHGHGMRRHPVTPCWQKCSHRTPCPYGGARNRDMAWHTSFSNNPSRDGVLDARRRLCCNRQLALAPVGDAAPQRTTSTGRGDFSGRQHSPTGSGVAANSLSICLTKVQILLRSFHETQNEDRLSPGGAQADSPGRCPGYKTPRPVALKGRNQVFTL
jgi:hypothetical protein